VSHWWAGTGCASGAGSLPKSVEEPAAIGTQKKGVRMAVGRDLDTVDQLAKQLLDGVGIAVLDDPADLGADGSELLGGRELRAGCPDLLGQLLSMGGQLVAALRELGDAGRADSCGHLVGLEGSQVVVEAGLGVA